MCFWHTMRICIVQNDVVSMLEMPRLCTEVVMTTSLVLVLETAVPLPLPELWSRLSTLHMFAAIF